MDDLVLKDSREIIERLGNNNHRFSGKRILLTGAAGFLGMQFMHYFCALNDFGYLSKPLEVLGIDSFTVGKPDWVTLFESRRDVKLLEKSIVNPINYKKNYDFIIHAASIASPSFYRKHPIETMDANVIGLRRILDFAVGHPSESVLFFSSSEVYGDPPPDRIPTTETYFGNVSCVGPRACYDESKRFGETLCVNFNRVHGVRVKIVRPFNNYGPGLKIGDRRVLPDFFRDVLVGRDIVMYSDGSPTRTFCYVSDAITGYLLALLSSYEAEVFNIGTESPEISMADLAKLVIEISGRPLKTIQVTSDDRAYLNDNPQRRCPDVSKARRMLGYNPKMPLEEGLKRLYEWYLQTGDSRLV
jgi:UDP-glucuronate decarboxylase